MELYITAPIRVDFSLTNSETAYKTDKFYNFWKELNETSFKEESIDKINYYKKEKEIHRLKSYDDKEKTNLEVLGIILTEFTKKQLKKSSSESFINKYFLDIKKSEIKVYDNTIGIFDLRINLKKIEDSDNKSFKENCEKEVCEFINNLLKEIKNSINKYFNFVKEKDKYEIIERKNISEEYNDYLDFYKEEKNLQIMWASCCLIYNNADENLNLLNEWLKESIEQDKIEIIKKDSKEYSLNWLKYVFREDVEDMQSLWDTMFLAQYYYSVIEIIVYNLRLIINESYSINKKRKFSFSKIFKKNEIIKINEKLEAISASANIHIGEYQDIKKYLKREHLYVFNKILEAWTFDDILDNTKSLLSTSKDRVDLIYNKISSKNNFYTDILLTSIGFFAIIDLVLSFSQYSREYTSDAMISSRGEEGRSFLFTISNIPIDIFLSIGFLSAFFLLLFIYFNRKNILP